MVCGKNSPLTRPHISEPACRGPCTSGAEGKRLFQSFLPLVTFLHFSGYQNYPFSQIEWYSHTCFNKRNSSFQYMFWGRCSPGGGRYLCVCRGWTRSVAMRFGSHRCRVTDVTAPWWGGLGWPRTGPGWSDFLNGRERGTVCCGGWMWWG